MAGMIAKYLATSLVIREGGHGKPPCDGTFLAPSRYLDQPVPRPRIHAILNGTMGPREHTSACLLAASNMKGAGS